MRGGRNVVGRVGATGNGELGLSAVFLSDKVWQGNGMLHDSGDPGLLVSCLQHDVVVSSVMCWRASGVICIGPPG